MILKLQPDRAALYNVLAVVLRYQGCLRKAIFHYDESLPLKPGFQQTTNNRAQALARQKMLNFQE